MSTTVSILPFSGTHNDFHAREFITFCEDVIKGTSITEEANKISFINLDMYLGQELLTSCKVVLSV